MKLGGVHHRTITQDGATIRLIDQRVLPFELRWYESHDVHATAFAIKDMVTRGAGAIGATAAAGLAQHALNSPDAGFHEHVLEGADILRRTRPTARNLFYGIEAVLGAIEDELVGASPSPARAREAALAAAKLVADDDAACCHGLGEVGAHLVFEGARVGTHCNAGWLAAVDWGSAIAPIYAAHRAGRRVHVWVDETRPRGQGARLTAYELGQEGVSHAIIPDNALGHWMRLGHVDLMIVGADRIAANGDVANKIGTYMAALAAKAHGVPFYVAAQTSTLDSGTPTGADIEIEERSHDEVLFTWGVDDDGRFVRVATTAPGSPARNPAFDVTPGELVAGIITERGLIPATVEGVASVARKSSRELGPR